MSRQPQREEEVRKAFDFSHLLNSETLLKEEFQTQKEWPELNRDKFLTKERKLDPLRHKAQLKWLFEKARMCRVREGANSSENCREYAELFTLLKLNPGVLDKGIFYRPQNKEQK